MNPHLLQRHALATQLTQRKIMKRSSSFWWHTDEYTEMNNFQMIQWNETNSLAEWIISGGLSIDAFCSLVYQLFLCHVIVFFVALSLCSFIRFIFEQSLKIVSPVVKFHAAASHWFCVSIMKASHSFCLTLIASKKYLNYTRFSLSRYRSIFFCLFIWITFKEH